MQLSKMPICYLHGGIMVKSWHMQVFRMEQVKQRNVLLKKYQKTMMIFAGD